MLTCAILMTHNNEGGTCEGSGYNGNTDDSTGDGPGTGENANFCTNERSEEECSVAPNCQWDADSFACKASSEDDGGAPMCYKFEQDSTKCVAEPQCEWDKSIQKCLSRDTAGGDSDNGAAVGANGGGANDLIDEDDSTDGECGALSDAAQCGRNTLHCKWDATFSACVHDMSDGFQKCMQVGGAGAPTEVACKAVAGCAWNKQTLTCSTHLKVCVYMELQADCNGAEACIWNAGTNACGLKVKPQLSTKTPTTSFHNSMGGGGGNDNNGNGNGNGISNSNGNENRNGGGGSSNGTPGGPDGVEVDLPKKRHTLAWVMALVIMGGIVVFIVYRRDNASSRGYRNDGLQKFSNPLAYEDEAYASQTHEA